MTELNEKILKCLDNNLCVHQTVECTNFYVNGTGAAADSIEKLIVQEKIDILEQILEEGLYAVAEGYLVVSPSCIKDKLSKLKLEKNETRKGI